MSSAGANADRVMGGGTLGRRASKLPGFACAYDHSKKFGGIDTGRTFSDG